MDKKSMGDLHVLFPGFSFRMTVKMKIKIENKD